MNRTDVLIRRVRDSSSAYDMHRAKTVGRHREKVAVKERGRRGNQPC